MMNNLTGQMNPFLNQNLIPNNNEMNLMNLNMHNNIQTTLN